MTEQGKRSILLIGDSFGIERQYQGQIYVPAEHTWPQQVKRHFADWQIETDFKSFRRYVELPELIQQQWPDVSIVVLHAGIVDCYPRPLSAKITRSTQSVHRTLRRIVRKMRRFWLNYLYDRPWSEPPAIEVATERLLKIGQKTPLVVITPSPVLTSEYRNTPGAQDAIINFANHLRQLSGAPNITLLDLHAEFMATPFEKYLHAKDAHFNQAGNDYLARRVIAVLEQLTEKV